MNKLSLIIAGIAILIGGGFFALTALAGSATPKVGDKAPDFTAQGALGGKEFSITLSEKWKKGPVVLYFFPKVFTKGCTAEAHEFAEQTEEFAKYGATIIGMSTDDIDGLKRFSSEECRDKFAVARATPDIVKAYDVRINPALNMTSRTSFVIDTHGKIQLVHSELDYRDHVKLTFAKVKELAGK